jgi:hypothetical protein
MQILSFPAIYPPQNNYHFSLNIKINILNPKTTSIKVSKLFCALAGILAGSSNLQGQNSTALTDKVFKGSGMIDLLKDVSAYDL